MAHHEWEHIVGFNYNSKFVEVQAYDTKGGQQSIFNDGIMGAFHVKLWRQPDQHDMNLLKSAYGHLDKSRFDQMVQHLSFFNTGEMQPQYIMRYGFYEGHTGWRADPIAIAYIFGLVDLPDLLAIFEGDLDKVLLDHYIE
jgi:hypothetical protein